MQPANAGISTAPGHIRRKPASSFTRMAGGGSPPRTSSGASMSAAVTGATASGSHSDLTHFGRKQDGGSFLPPFCFAWWEVLEQPPPARKRRNPDMRGSILAAFAAALLLSGSVFAAEATA